ncbi:hypothetical protein [Sphaerisporangium sp. TRM90804]|uniref:hypothetical protein n=1 Tax=Sphaerisporangium sp. TRM90804 TaxID=3031113 RepID=UPI00244C90D4|nr:hypothetical protein [Sphaerisporangium sp. TRM90804]MDH2425445.1 hypothetical protein [Sphaerisporangium sp. TRM90804]
MARASRWKTVGLVMALSGGALLTTGSVAHADPGPDAVELRLVLDDCPKGAPTVAP